MIAWDVFRLLVLMPSAIAGTVLFLLVAIGAQPFYSTLIDVAEAIDSQAGEPGDGMILVKERTCLPAPPEPVPIGEPKPIPGFDHCGDLPRYVEQPIELSVDNAIESVRTAYLVLVAVGFFFMVTFGMFDRYGDRRDEADRIAS